MTELGDLLRPDAVTTGVAAASRKAVFQHLATALARAAEIDPRTVAEAIAAREKLGSTGFGGGVAIDWQAVDALPVDLVFAIVSPPGAGAEHLKALARVSRRLRDRAFLAKLRGAASRDALYALFTADAARDAA